MESMSNEWDFTKIAEVDLVYKTSVKPSERPLIKESKDVGPLIMKLWDPERIGLYEEFKVLLLNQANRVLGVFNASKGGLTGTVADPRLIFAAALKSGCCSIILAHNHPSGNLKPSRADEELTHKIKEAGRFLDIRVLDHVIVSSEGYYSFADEGLL